MKTNTSQLEHKYINVLNYYNVFQDTCKSTNNPTISDNKNPNIDNTPTPTNHDTPIITSNEEELFPQNMTIYNRKHQNNQKLNQKNVKNALINLQPIKKQTFKNPNHPIQFQHLNLQLT